MDFNWPISQTNCYDKLLRIKLDQIEIRGELNNFEATEDKGSLVTGAA